MRKKYAAAIAVVGTHALTAVLEERPEAVLEIWVCSQPRNNHQQILDKATDLGIAIHQVKPHTIAEIDDSCRGILGWCRPPALHSPQWLQENISQGLLLALDRVTDAHNFGACLRSAEAAGVAAVLIAGSNAAGLSAGAAKSASGALFRIPLVRCPSLAGVIGDLVADGWHCAALLERAKQSLYDTMPKAKQLVVLGNEQHGVHPQIASSCQQHISIPTSGRNASLNVAVATGVTVLWLANRMPR